MYKTFNKIFRHLVSLAILGAIFIFPRTIINAEDLTSPNYKIEGATISGGDLKTSTNFSLLSTVNELTGNPYAESTLYTVKLGSLETFVANTPKISCFETDSSGSSNCSTGPSYLNSNGLVTICGAPGCYNSARVEIDTQNNPADTLYGIQISEDNFVSDIKQIDGTLLTPKDFANRTITDYKTKTNWESNTLNIKGLKPGTQVWVRITALHGDYTESTYSPVISATTAQPSVDFDIDIAPDSGSSTETGTPYSIAFTGSTRLFSGSSLQTATDLIWLDLSTNAARGSVILEVGDNGGLYSASGPYTIVSATADLSIVSEGFGIQNYDYTGSGEYCSNIDGGGSGELGNLTVTADYAAPTLNSVGIIDTDFSKLYDGNAPLLDCRTALKVKAKASANAIAASDYTETITLIAVPRY